MSLFFKKQSYKSQPLETLVQEAQNDDIQALEEIIKREQKNIYATLYYLKNSKEDILDNTQEILLKMSKNLKNLKNPKAFKSWLNQIVMRFYYDTIRKKNRNPQTIPVEKISKNNDNFNPYEWLLIDKKKKPDEHSLYKELDEIITQAIKSLPEQLKIAIVLREFQGLSYDDIAEVTNSNLGTVKSRIARARNKLQEILQDYMK